MTPWLAEGHSTAWLEQIERTARLLSPGVIAYPGHGAAAPADALVAAQRNYVQQFRALIAEASVGGRFTAEARRAVIAVTERRYAGWPPVAGVPDLVGINADAVAREMGLNIPAT